MTKAEVGGWVALCTYALGGDDLIVASILLRVQRGAVAMSAIWVGDPGAKQGRPTGLGFDGAWRRDGRATRRVTYTQFSHYLADPGTEPLPTAAASAKAQEIQEREQGEMLVAIQAMLADGASVVRVLPYGEDDDWCRGHVPGGPPLGKQLCTNPAVQGLPYCAGPCVRR